LHKQSRSSRTDRDDVGDDAGDDIGDNFGEDIGEDSGEDTGEHVGEDVRKCCGRCSVMLHAAHTIFKEAVKTTCHDMITIKQFHHDSAQVADTSESSTRQVMYISKSSYGLKTF